jgi:exonuclease SbcD
MRFFHLADLHLGKTLKHTPLLDDQEYILERVLDYVRAYKPAAVLIAGDIFDRQNPGTGAIALLDRFLTGLVRLDTQVLMISGNHDSPERISFAKEILQQGGVHVSGAFQGSLQEIRLADEHGTVCYHLLPFIHSSAMRRFHPDDSPVDSHAMLERLLADTVLDPDCRHVLMLHQTVASARFRSDSEQLVIGYLDAVKTELFRDFAYVALGHLHTPQDVDESRIRYAGSPLMYSVAELHTPKSLVCVDLDAQGKAHTELLPLVPKRQVCKYEGTYEGLAAAASRGELGTGDLLYVQITDTEPIADLQSRVREILPQLLSCQQPSCRSPLPDRLAEVDPEDKTALALFQDFYRERTGEALDAEQLAIVSAIFEEVEHEAATA